MVIPWATDVATTLNAVLAGQASLSFGESLRVCASETPQLYKIDALRGGSELRISADGPVRVTGIEMVPTERAVQTKERGGA